MAIACFFEELLEVVHRQSLLAPAIAYGLCGMLHIAATYLLVDAATVVDRGLLAVLFAPFLADIGILDCGAGYGVYGSLAVCHCRELIVFRSFGP
jgi:hypothetical protein